MVELATNLVILAGLASLGIGIFLAIVGAISSRRTGSRKLPWVSVGFFLLGLQGGILAFVSGRQPTISVDIVVPAFLGLLALFAFYVAVYRRG